MSLLAENVIKMYSRLLPGSDRSACWLINKNVLPQLFTMSLAVGTGGVPLYMPANSMAGQPFQTLFGLPVIAIEQAATLGTVGDIILADLTNGYILAEKGGIKSDMSIHVRFIYDESVFRFVLRIDGAAPSAPLTPYKRQRDPIVFRCAGDASIVFTSRGGGPPGFCARGSSPGPCRGRRAPVYRKTPMQTSRTVSAFEKKRTAGLSHPSSGERGKAKVQPPRALRDELRVFQEKGEKTWHPTQSGLCMWDLIQIDVT